MIQRSFIQSTYKYSNCMRYCCLILIFFAQGCCCILYCTITFVDRERDCHDWEGFDIALPACTRSLLTTRLLLPLSTAQAPVQYCFLTSRCALLLSRPPSLQLALLARIVRLRSPGRALTSARVTMMPISWLDPSFALSFPSHSIDRLTLIP